MGAFYGRRRFILAFLITVTFTFDQVNQVTQKLFSPNGVRTELMHPSCVLSFHFAEKKTSVTAWPLTW